LELGENGKHEEIQSAPTVSFSVRGFLFPRLGEQIRNSNTEIRNKSETQFEEEQKGKPGGDSSKQKLEIRNPKQIRNSEKRGGGFKVRLLFSSFLYHSPAIRVCFEIRYSDFDFSPSRAAPSPRNWDRDIKVRAMNRGARGCAEGLSARSR
jgi:hypothetical protein